MAKPSDASQPGRPRYNTISRGNSRAAAANSGRGQRNPRFSAILPIGTSLVAVLVAFAYTILGQHGFTSAERLSKIAGAIVITASTLGSAILIQKSLTLNRRRKNITAIDAVRRQERELLDVIAKEVRAMLSGDS